MSPFAARSGPRDLRVATGYTPAMNVAHPTIIRPATYQDVLDAPPNTVAELIGGALHLQPRPRPKHSRSASRLGQALAPFDLGPGPGGWLILDEPELHLGADVLVPDLAAWRREQLPELPDEVGIETPPEWVCEVLSPSTRTYDVTEKRAIYARHAVAHLWFIDPDARTLEAFVWRDGMYAVQAALHDDEEVRLTPFADIAFPLSVLWP